MLVTTLPLALDSVAKFAKYRNTSYRMPQGTQPHLHDLSQPHRRAHRRQSHVEQGLSEYRIGAKPLRLRNAKGNCQRTFVGDVGQIDGQQAVGVGVVGSLLSADLYSVGAVKHNVGGVQIVCQHTLGIHIARAVGNHHGVGQRTVHSILFVRRQRCRQTADNGRADQIGYKSYRLGFRAVNAAEIRLVVCKYFCHLFPPNICKRHYRAFVGSSTYNPIRTTSRVVYYETTAICVKTTDNRNKKAHTY